jgi:uncharacterized protein with PQ loop repeat
MRWLINALLWIYDFLAEDAVLLIGTVIAFAVAVLAVHAARNAAGIILFAVIVAVIAASLWRTVATSRS